MPIRHFFRGKAYPLSMVQPLLPPRKQPGWSQIGYDGEKSRIQDGHLFGKASQPEAISVTFDLPRQLGALQTCGTDGPIPPADQSSADSVGGMKPSPAQCHPLSS